MFMRSAFKQVGFRTLGSGFFLERRIADIIRKDELPILNFHKVNDAPAQAYEATSPAIFDDIIGWLGQFFEFATFNDLDPARPHKHPAVILSFDDGYRDFVEIVAPILRKHGVRANMNVIPGCVESGLPPRNVILKDFIAQAPSALLRETPLPGLPDGADPDRRVESGLRASAAFKNMPIQEQDAAWPAILPLIEKFDGFRPTEMMTHAHIAQALDEHEFGLHSFEHATMKVETLDYLRTDVQKCRAWWSDATGRDSRIYAFPNGAATPEQVQVVSENGFSTILLVGEQFSSAANQVHPRITMFARDKYEARVRALGGARARRTERAA